MIFKALRELLAQEWVSAHVGPFMGHKSEPGGGGPCA